MSQVMRVKEILENVEFGFETFSEEEQRVLTKIGERIDKIANVSLKDLLLCYRDCLKRRDIYKNANLLTRQVVDMGGLFVTMEMVYTIFPYLSVFCTTDETVDILQECVELGTEIMKESIEKRKDNK